MNPDLFPPIHLYALMAAGIALLTNILRIVSVQSKSSVVTAVLAYLVTLASTLQILIDLNRTFWTSPCLTPYGANVVRFHAIAVAVFFGILIAAISDYKRYLGQKDGDVEDDT